MSYALTCASSERVSPADRDRICKDFQHHLKVAYPEGGVRQTDKEAGLELRILAATQSTLSIQLTWTTSSGDILQGEVETVSAMDRGLTKSRQVSLYQRALANTPPPR